jgi:predicted ATPase
MGERPLLERLKSYLRDRKALLLLDNFEHVAPASPVVAELLRACPLLEVLVTSRAVLHLSGEHEYPMSPLGLPDPERLPAPEEMGRYEAVDLFAERARAARPDFRLDARDAARTPTVSPTPSLPCSSTQPKTPTRQTASAGTSSPPHSIAPHNNCASASW